MQSTMIEVYSQYIILPVYFILHVVVYKYTVENYQIHVVQQLVGDGGKNVLFCRVLVIHFI